MLEAEGKAQKKGMLKLDNARIKGRGAYKAGLSKNST